MVYLFKGVKLAVALLWCLSLAGIAAALIKSQRAVALGLLPVACWMFVILINPESLPLFTHDLDALRFFRVIFLALAAFFFCAAAWVCHAQLPRVFAKRYAGTVVRLDDTHPNAINYAYPVIRFVDERGESHEFSNFSAMSTPFKKTSKMPPVRIGDAIQVFWDVHDQRYIGVTRNESAVFAFLFLATALPFLFSISASLISHVRYESLEHGGRKADTTRK